MMNNVTRVVFGIGIVLCISVSVLALSTVGVPAGSLNQSDEEKWNDSGLLYGINKTEYIHVYDFSTGAGEDKWAFRNETGASPGVNDPNIKFTTAQYEKINTSDDTRQEDQTHTNGYYAAHRFNISILEDASDIRKINVTWEGIGDHQTSTDGAKLYIYNFSSTAYEQLDSATTSPPTEITLTGEKTSSISSYINANNVTVLVNQTSAQTVGLGTEYSYIKTDYVKLELHI